MQLFEHERQAIQALEAVAKYGNVSQAATHLFLTQPTVSKVIRNQEKHFGVSLIDRSKHPLKLTYAGEFYLEQMRQLVSGYQVMRHDLAHFVDDRVGQLTVGVNPTLAQVVLPAVMPTFHRQYPQIQVQLLEKTSAAMEAAVLEQELDLYIGISPVYNRQLRYLKLYGENGALLLPKTWDAPRQLVADISPLINGHDFIQETESSGFQRIVTSYLTKYRVQPKTILRTDNISTAVSLTKGGLGATIVPQSLVGTLPPNGYHVVAISPTAFQCDVSIAYSTQRALPTQADHFIELARQRFASPAIEQE